MEKAQKSAGEPETFVDYSVTAGFDERGQM